MVVSKYPIKTVADNIEKGLSYKENFKRNNKAKASVFHLECLWILYAISKDRTSAFLYYLGFTSDEKRSSATGSKNNKQQVRQILQITVDNSKYKFDTISGKFSRITDVITWSKTVDGEISDYQIAVKKAVKFISDNEGFISALTYLNDEWRDKRNQLTHSLFNKDPDTVIAELKSLIEKGYIAVRVFDNAVEQLKKPPCFDMLIISQNKAKDECADCVLKIAFSSRKPMIFSKSHMNTRTKVLKSYDFRTFCMFI